MRKNKCLALVGALTMATLGSSAVGAISTDGNGVVTTESGSNTISVTNVESTDTFVICKIIDVKYDSNTNVVSYDFTSTFDAFKASTEGSSYSGLSESTYQGYTGSSITSGNLTTNTDLDNLAAAYASYLRSHGNTGCSNMTVSGTTASATVSTAGGYLIIPTSSTKIYSVMVGNIGVDSSLQPDTSSASIVAKKGNPGAIVKTANGATFAIGEAITYDLEIQIPSYPSNAINTKYTITDTPTQNILIDTTQPLTISCVSGHTCSLSNGNVVYDGNTIGTYTVTSSGITIVLNSTKNVASPLHFGYTGEIKDTATSNVAQTNTATLAYPEDVYDENSATNTTTDTADVKTLGIKVKKTDTSGNPLSGAEFELYSDSGYQNKVTCYTDPTASANTTSTTIVVTSSPENSAGFCRGIKAGTYYLKETKAPTGYAINSNVFTLTVSDQNATDGISGSQTITTGYLTQTVTDSQSNFALPFTGGRGVIIYAIAGVGIVGVASVYYYRKKKSEA